MNELNPNILKTCPPLEASFFERDTLSVARNLLGCYLFRYLPETNNWIKCAVVETEAYTADDPACHAYQRKTGRAEMLYGHPGTTYVYLIYGIYNCLNVVTEAYGTAGAVLFRALEPLGENTDLQTNGPGRLTRALDITRQAFNGLPLTDPASGLYLAAGQAIPDSDVVQCPRIGITKAMDYPWRFYIRDNVWVSRKAPKNIL